MPPSHRNAFRVFVAPVSAGKRQTRAQPQTTIREAVSASYGSWRGVLEPGQPHRQAPPWLASAAGLPYQIGDPTTEAADRLSPGLGNDAATHDVAEPCDTPRLTR